MDSLSVDGFEGVAGLGVASIVPESSGVEKKSCRFLLKG